MTQYDTIEELLRNALSEIKELKAKDKKPVKVNNNKYQIREKIKQSLKIK